MGLRRFRPLVIFSVRKSELVILIGNLVKRRLTSKQKRIIFWISSSKEETSVTNSVKKLSENLKCSYTTIWHNLKQLKEIGIVKSLDKGSKKSRPTLTKEGKLVLRLMKGGKS